ncbi:Adenylate and Guanylate cyclase catalytic domain-containing protein [Bradyrhizobium shewense]|uniref:Adenylate and Guanylate cyclase catalytic domain-containing protein n=1 Tax=Bradyrhizobium shewense TaxID=1761772 RepID=A0A1C3XET3_9BRAD|nr:BTAD domain-containing putative transcriptional regulator [Bradyrhizobium shewense]SCB50645.1 Adenylate and Guanylate cyclase catalytic domain-containing protein [Bradyrhizobium shewense]
MIAPPLRPKFNLSVLGRFVLNGPNGVVSLPNKKLAGLLAYLGCTAPVAQPRERLATLLWGSRFDVQARQNLRQALFKLRQILGPDALESGGEFVSLNAAVVWCDAGQFEALVREGGRDALSAAADLYRGRLIDDVGVSEEGWSDWLAFERDRFQELALSAMVELGEKELAAGRNDHALKAGQRANALNNMREDAHRLIVQALSATGRKAEALKYYQDVVALLQRELGTEPDAATRLLAAELRSAQQPAQSHRPTDDTVSPLRQRPPQPSIAMATLVARDDASPAMAVSPGDLEQRQLTILVCKLVDSLSDRLDAEDVHDLIAVFHKMAAELVAQFGGFVAHYQGDGALVYFGYPAAHEHDAEQAVRAGRALLDAAVTLKSSFGVTLQASAGIASGLVVVGEKATAGDKRQHVAIGDAPNLAARLQAAASSGEVLIADSTRRLVGRMFDCSAFGAIGGNGLAAWKVDGENVAASRFDARRGTVMSPLMGRQEEIELLLRRWAQAQLGEGRVVLLSGEPGIGKSRIAESLLPTRDGEPFARLRFFCSPHYTHSPLYPLTAQLERAAGFEPGNSDSAKFDKLEALLKLTAKNVPRDVALIAELLALPADERYPALEVSPQKKREMTFTALLDQLDGAATRSPILILFEDIHWIDPTSLDLLDRLIARAATMPVLLVVTFRPEFQPTWVDQPHVTMLPLSRLGRRDSAGIIEGITKGKALPEAVVEQVLARADGVPLFIEELMSALLESGLLRDTTDGYALDRPLPPLAIPSTLRASLVARLDRLTSVKGVAQIGAAIGREFSHELITAVASLSPEDLDEALRRLTVSGLVSRRGTPPIATYAFKHALVQDAAYATMLKSRRRQLHANIANVLVKQFPVMTETLPEVVAHHFTEAGFASEAIEYWRKAARLAHVRWALREAVEFFEQALGVLTTLPESPSTLEQGFDIRLELRQVVVQLGEFRRSLLRLREAEALAERMDDDRRRGRFCAVMTGMHGGLGELDDGLTCGTRALEIAGRLGDLRLRILATSFVAQVHFFRGEHARVVDLTTDNLSVLPAGWGMDNFGIAAPPSVYDRGYLILSLAELGRFEEATEPAAEAIRLVASPLGAYAAGWAHLSDGTVHVLQGEWAQARPALEHAIAAIRTGDLPLLLPLSVVFSAWTLAQLGDASGALSMLREGEQLIERQVAAGYVGNLGWLYPWLGRAALSLGRLDDAQRLGDCALESSPHQPGFAAHALHLLGEVAIHPDRFHAERGERHFRQALALAEPRGMRPLVAHCQFGLGKLYRRKGTREQARKHFATATTLYRAMDLPFWLEQVESEMG